MPSDDPDDPPQLPHFEKVGRRFVPTDYSPEPVAGRKAEEVWRPMAYVGAATRRFATEAEVHERTGLAPVGSPSAHHHDDPWYPGKYILKGGRAVVDGVEYITGLSPSARDVDSAERVYGTDGAYYQTFSPQKAAHQAARPASSSPHQPYAAFYRFAFPLDGVPSEVLRRIEVSLEGGCVTLSAELTIRASAAGKSQVWRLFGRCELAADADADAASVSCSRTRSLLQSHSDEGVRLLISVPRRSAGALLLSSPSTLLRARAEERGKRIATPQGLSARTSTRKAEPRANASKLEGAWREWRATDDGEAAAAAEEEEAAPHAAPASLFALPRAGATRLLSDSSWDSHAAHAADSARGGGSAGAAPSGASSAATAGGGGGFATAATSGPAEPPRTPPSGGIRMFAWRSEAATPDALHPGAGGEWASPGALNGGEWTPCKGPEGGYVRRPASSHAHGASAMASDDFVHFETRISRNEIGFGLRLSDDNTLLSVDAEGGAAKATVPLVEGDRVVALNGHALVGTMISYINPAVSTYTMLVRRRAPRKRQPLTVKVRRGAGGGKEGRACDALGLIALPATNVVLEVVPGSAAASVLLPGDQLLAVDQTALREGELHALTLAAKHTHSLKIYRHVHRV